MFCVITEHIKSECVRVIQLLQDDFCYQKISSGEKKLIKISDMKLFKLDNAMNIFKDEELHFDDYLIHFSDRGNHQLFSIKNSLTQNNFAIEWFKGELDKETYSIADNLIREIEYSEGKMFLLIYHESKLIITFDYFGYEVIAREFRSYSDDYDQDDAPEYDFYLENEGNSQYEIPIKLGEIRHNNLCNSELHESKLLEGVFIDPYIDKYGHQNFRSIMRPGKPFCDNQGNPISSSQREQLKEHLNNLMKNRNYPIYDILMSF